MWNRLSTSRKPVRLLLDDGTVLAEEPAQIDAGLGRRGPYQVAVPFTISGERQAFIQVFISSPRDGRTVQLNSVGLIIADSGPEEIVRVDPHRHTSPYTSRRRRPPRRAAWLRVFALTHAQEETAGHHGGYGGGGVSDNGRMDANDGAGDSGAEAQPAGSLGNATQH
jgi:hypothetical protein